MSCYQVDRYVMLSSGCHVISSCVIAGELVVHDTHTASSQFKHHAYGFGASRRHELRILTTRNRRGIGRKHTRIHSTRIDSKRIHSTRIDSKRIDSKRVSTGSVYELGASTHHKTRGCMQGAKPCKPLHVTHYTCKTSHARHHMQDTTCKTLDRKTLDRKALDRKTLH